MATKKSNVFRLQQKLNTQLGTGLVSAMNILHAHYARQIQTKVVKYSDALGRKSRRGIGRSSPGEYPAKDLGHGLANWKRNGVTLIGLEVRSGFNAVPATADPEDDGGEHMCILANDNFQRLSPKHAYDESQAQMRAAFQAVVR